MPYSAHTMHDSALAAAGGTRTVDTVDREFFVCVRLVIDAGRIRDEARFVQHGATSTLLHSLAVAYTSVAIAHQVGWDSLTTTLCRAALLHDYYLYDWHVPSRANRLHGFRHPELAARNALMDYPDLSEHELDAIRCHMFPLAPLPPAHRIGWIVTLADKICALRETRARRGDAYPELRAKCARYLPDLELGPLP